MMITGLSEWVTGPDIALLVAVRRTVSFHDEDLLVATRRTHEECDLLFEQGRIYRESGLLFEQRMA